MDTISLKWLVRFSSTMSYHCSAKRLKAVWVWHSKTHIGLAQQFFSHLFSLLKVFLIARKLFIDKNNRLHSVMSVNPFFFFFFFRDKGRKCVFLNLFLLIWLLERVDSYNSSVLGLISITCLGFQGEAIASLINKTVSMFSMLMRKTK